MRVPVFEDIQDETTEGNMEEGENEEDQVIEKALTPERLVVFKLRMRKTFPFLFVPSRYSRSLLLKT